MSELKYFLKENKIKRENVFFKASESLRDEKGEAVSWELRPVSTMEDEQIREECLIRGKDGIKPDFSSYIKKLAVAAVVFPPLYNAQLQDSYGVKSPEDLLQALLDKPGEYQELVRKIQKLNGFDVTMEKRVEEAKNL